MESDSNKNQLPIVEQVGENEELPKSKEEEQKLNEDES